MPALEVIHSRPVNHFQYKASQVILKMDHCSHTGIATDPLEQA